jgi:hypothetical protein
MLIRSIAAPILTAAVLGLVAGLPAAAQAQSGSSRGTTAGPTVIYSDPGRNAAARKNARRTAAKPRPAPRVVRPDIHTTSITAQDLPTQREWQIEDALPTRRPDDTRRNVPTVSSPQLGRIPLQSGSFGFSTESSVKSDRLSDGRRAPGLESVTRNEPNYFGLSLSVPTESKGILPAPPWGRP